MTAADMPQLAGFIARALAEEPETVTEDVAAWRGQFREIHFTTDNPV